MPEEEIVNGLIAAVTKTFNGQLRLLANRSYLSMFTTLEQIKNMFYAFSMQSVVNRR